jgi:hypothetical protein
MENKYYKTSQLDTTLILFNHFFSIKNSYKNVEQDQRFMEWKYEKNTIVASL